MKPRFWKYAIIQISDILLFWEMLPFLCWQFFVGFFLCVFQWKEGNLE